MSFLNRFFLVSSFVIAVVDVAFATKTSSPGLFIASLGLALLAAALVVRQHRPASSRRA